MVKDKRRGSLTVAAALYPLGGIWPPRPEPESERVRIWTRRLVRRLRALREGLAARQARRELLALDDRTLKDIGLSRCALMGLDIDPATSRPRR